MTFANFRDHCNPLSIRLNILKFHDLVGFQTAIFMRAVIYINYYSW